MLWICSCTAFSFMVVLSNANTAVVQSFSHETGKLSDSFCSRDQSHESCRKISCDPLSVPVSFSLTLFKDRTIHCFAIRDNNQALKQQLQQLRYVDPKQSLSIILVLLFNCCASLVLVLVLLHETSCALPWLLLVFSSVWFSISVMCHSPRHDEAWRGMFDRHSTFPHVSPLSLSMSLPFHSCCPSPFISLFLIAAYRSVSSVWFSARCELLIHHHSVTSFFSCRPFLPLSPLLSHYLPVSRCPMCFFTPCFSLTRSPSLTFSIAVFAHHQHAEQ